MNGALFLFVGLIVVLFLGVPIGFSLMLVTAATFYFFTDVDLILCAQTSVTGLDSFPILAVPFFMLAGVLMGRGGVAKRLVNVAQCCVGHLVGGLAMVTTVACMFFGAISGSAVATVSSIGGFMIPEMKRCGYKEEFSAAVAACAGTIGIVIPPSLSLVIYGVVTNTSIGDLFIADIVPGVLMTLIMCIISYRICKKEGFPVAEKQPIKNLFPVLWDAKWALITPIIILGGIYSGFFTPTEAAVVACVYSIIVGLFIYREMTWKDLWDGLIEAMKLNGLTMFMVGTATAFAKYLSFAQIPTLVTSMIMRMTQSKILILLVMNAILLFLGCLCENIVIITILAPIFLPLAMACGLTPIQFGIMISFNTTIGLITPPYGADLFVATAISGVKMERMLKYVIPYLVGLLLLLALITYFPGISTFML